MALLMKWGSMTGDTGTIGEQGEQDAETGGPHLVADNPGLWVEKIGKSFKGRPVVRGVSFHVQRGEAVGLLGPNGAGKTTVFYMITGLIQPDYGVIRLDGHDVTDLPMYRRARRGIGYLPQEASIFRGMTVEQNIRAVLEVIEPDRDRREAELDDLLAEFSITHLRRTPSIALSGGERRRVEIARALATRPSFMLLDEPFAGIDPLAIADILEEAGVPAGVVSVVYGDPALISETLLASPVIRAITFTGSTPTAAMLGPKALGGMKRPIPELSPINI